MKVSITGITVTQTRKIPASSVLTSQDGSTFVMMAGSDGAAHRKAIALGILDGEEVQESWSPFLPLRTAVRRQPWKIFLLGSYNQRRSAGKQ